MTRIHDAALAASAEVLRFVTRVPRNEEFVYYYWEHCQLTHIIRQRVVGVRFYGNTPPHTVDDVTTAVLERPEYIPPLLWMIYEDPYALALSPERLSKDLGRLAELVTETDAFVTYLEHRVTCLLNNQVNLLRSIASNNIVLLGS
ncbi:4-(cytidine 5 -diphospho)-2-C-methyl-D-erythritol kinase, putative [Babesia ovata]|uniref:4-(Cytidine 5-diphospho)-2-C-methyl-D-erythritol kinase, putative n=1 Tax=Babesia ovata TaxID=189622 RepID=A0A2H6K6Z3_9APIC|nr:4-(cytidine 5 -diphospho)-2-C-methyl-D-erythritol kinase, putative [Babesia ovata]GBE58755.1 4-(cytidine 5 -diphospho)-2-C-methyl-D-erythritol kinase, putative [Babesia ovata]